MLRQRMHQARHAAHGAPNPTVRSHPVPPMQACSTSDIGMQLQGPQPFHSASTRCHRRSASSRPWRRRCRQYVPPSAALSAAADNSGPGLNALQPAVFLDSLWKFSRPHTMLGTFVSVTSISLLAVQSQPTAQLATVLIGLSQALVSALLMNIAIVGINQLSDVEIDKINKPYLPLASGEFSMQTGVLIVTSTTIISLIIGLMSQSLPLMATLVVSLLLGILYSVELPFMRWKRSPLLAAGCILAVRALAVQLGFFWHMQAVLSGVTATAMSFQPEGFMASLAALQVTPSITFTICFMLLFSIVIALFKDIPDVPGDKNAGLRTLTVRLGVSRVFWACIWILTAAYAGAVTYSVLAAHFWSAAVSAPVSAGATTAISHGLGSIMPASLSLIGGSGGNLGLRVLACVGGHCVLAGLLWQRALKTDLSSNSDISACYMHVWKLFYSEYILIPLLL